jgi:hypothetical protein
MPDRRWAPEVDPGSRMRTISSKFPMQNGEKLNVKPLSGLGRGDEKTNSAGL